MKVCAILLCGGLGKRLGADVPKALVELAGRPLFTWPLESLQQSGAIHAIVVVGPSKSMRELLAAAGLSDEKIIAWVEGGRERQESVARGLAAIPEEFDHVAVHDSARALVRPLLISRVVGDAVAHGAAIVAVPLEDTLKRVTLGAVDATVAREGLYRAQTPQVFRRDLLERAHREAKGEGTDDAVLVEAIGHRVYLTEGDSLNLKITTPADLALAEAWFEAGGRTKDLDVSRGGGRHKRG